jgi:hypothetical protein
VHPGLYLDDTKGRVDGASWSAAPTAAIADPDSVAAGLTQAPGRVAAFVLVVGAHRSSA